jgi:hypothetical protein
MKVTALIPEDMIRDVKKYSGGRNITDSLLIALTDYLSRQRIKKLVKRVKAKPLEFRSDFSADLIRKINRYQ